MSVLRVLGCGGDACREAALTARQDLSSSWRLRPGRPPGLSAQGSVGVVSSRPLAEES
jgi:hypothetical protein